MNISVCFNMSGYQHCTCRYRSSKHYCVINLNDGRFGCDFCSKTNASGESLKAQELQNTNIRNIKCVNNGARLFIELDTLIDIEDRVSRILSAKYELLIFNKTNKLKYVIGCIHLLDLIENKYTFTTEKTNH